MIPSLKIGGETRAFTSTQVMGVVNASPESFSDAGRFDSLNAQLELAASLIRSGADIIDVGGQSAVTNQPELDASLECDRVLPIVEWLKQHHPEVLVSVDTYKPKVAAATLAAGADIINDVSGLRHPELASMCAEFDAALVIMHTAAPPKIRLQQVDLYRDIVHEVRDFLVERMATAVGVGLAEESIIVDPGPDFTKTPRQTVDLLQGIAAIRDLGRPVLLALSRKDFLGAITQRTPKGRDAATAAALAFFAASPGNIVRVHDVAAAVDVIATVETLAGFRDIQHDYVLPDLLRYEARSE